MPHTRRRIYTHYTKAAAILLGQSIKLGRKQKKWTETELSKRAGISRATLQKIEKGDLRCEIGLVFEVASLVGVKLFDADLDGLRKETDRMNDKIALLPRSIRSHAEDFDDEF